MLEPLVITGIDAAIFLALNSFWDHTGLRFPQRERMVESIEAPVGQLSIINTDRLGRVSYSYMVPCYNSIEEWHQAVKPYEVARIKYVYNLLKEQYPEKDYAELYKKKMYSDYWTVTLNLDIDQLLS